MLNYWWRLFATGFSFTTFGLGGLFLSTFVFPVVLLITPDPVLRRKRARWFVALTFRFFFWMMEFLGLLRLKVTGRERVLEDRGCIVVANHPSLIDVICLISLYPHSCCIVKKELWSNPFLKGVVRAAGYIQNSEPETLLKKCQESLDRGDVIIIFPEGTRSVPGEPMRLQRGAAHLAIRLNRPIQTVQIAVNPTTLTKAEPWYSIPPRRVDFDVKIKEKRWVHEILTPGIPNSVAVRHLTRWIQSNIDIDKQQNIAIKSPGLMTHENLEGT